MRQNKDFLNDHTRKLSDKAVAGNRVFYLDNQPVRKVNYPYSQHKATTDTFALSRRDDRILNDRDDSDITNRLIVSDNTIPVALRSPQPGQVCMVSGPFIIKAELSNKKSGFLRVGERPGDSSQSQGANQSSSSPFQFLDTSGDSQILYSDSHGIVCSLRL